MKNHSLSELDRFDRKPIRIPVNPEKVYSSIIDVIFAIDEHGIFQYVSPSSIYLFGYEADEMTGVSFIHFIHPEDIDKTVSVVSEKIHDCKSSNFENRYIRNDGTIVSIIWSGRWDENDRLLYCVARDGSERNELQHRLQNAQKLARVANFEFDFGIGIFNNVSETFYEICGLSPEQHPVIDLAFYRSLIHPEDISLVQQKFQDPEKELASTDYRIIRPDGTLVYLDHQRELVFDEEGKLVKIIGVIQDITERKLAIQELRQTEERFRYLVQNGNDILGIIDLEGKYIFVGANVKEQLGFCAEEMIGKSAFEFIHPDDIPFTMNALQQLVDKKMITVGPFRFKNASGEWRWFETTASNHLDHPSIKGLVVNSRDVTEKKQKDDELERLSLIAQESHSPMVISNLSHVITWVNKSFLQLNGLTFEETIGKRTDELFLTDQMDNATHNQVQIEMEHGKTIKREIRCLSKAGDVYWLDLTIQPIYNNQGVLTYFLGVGKDISEKKKAEMERLQAEKRFRAMVQNGSDLILVLNTEAHFSYISENVHHILGYCPEELIGINALDLIHPAEKDLVKQELHSIINKQSRDKNSTQHRFLHKNGSWVWLESKGINHLENPFIGGILVNSRNITDRIELENRLKLELLHKQKEITSAVIRAQENERSQLGLELHDNVNQVLTTVKLYHEMYLTGLVRDQELLARSAKYTQDCINEIRSISKRLSTPTLGKISLEDSIRELIDSVNLTKRIKIHYITRNLDNITITEEIHLAIYRIVQEGLTNIIKYSNAEQAWVAISLDKGSLCLKIWDNGKGFDTTAKSDGIGITNMKTRAENLNATFQLFSAPGKGCSIEISFSV